LPKRLVVTCKLAEGQPQFWPQVSDWNLSPDVPDSLIVVTPPPGAARINDRSLNGLIGSHVVGDLYRVYTAAQRDGIKFNLAHVPEDYDSGPQEFLAHEAMKRLF
jgi:hypothetical protein